MKHTKREVENYKNWLELVEGHLLASLKKFEIDNEQFIGECNVLGVDRKEILDSFRKSIKGYKNKTLKKVDAVQETDE